MILAILGGTIFLVIIVLGATAMIKQDAVGFFMTVGITLLFTGSLYAFLFGLAQLGVIGK